MVSAVTDWDRSRYPANEAERAERRRQRDAMIITKRDLAQAVFYGLTELYLIKRELGVE
jgi:hypothetical protein